jgi:hypothetical protein
MGSTYDIPMAVGEILEKVKRMSEPGTPVRDERPLDRFLSSGGLLEDPRPKVAVSLLPAAEPLNLVRNDQEGGTPSGPAQSVIMCGPGTRNLGPGMFATPVQYKNVEQNYGPPKAMGKPLHPLIPVSTPHVGLSQGSQMSGPHWSQDQGPPKGSPIPTVQIGKVEHRRGFNPAVRNLDQTYFSVPPPPRDVSQEGGGQAYGQSSSGPNAKRVRTRWNF